MREPNKVKVTIVSITKGECSQGFKVGATWIIDRFQTPSPPMCSVAYGTILPAIVNMRYGGEFTWDEENVTWFSCPDPNHQVIYEIRRLPEKGIWPGHRKIKSTRDETVP